MTNKTEAIAEAAAGADRKFKAGVRGMWAKGDYARFAELVWPLGPVLVEAAGVRPGQRLLDVACGTGNVAIRAAEAGAEVVASDLTPENFPAGERIAKRSGVEIEWVEGDAEALPFGDAEFDIVTSAVGAMFAPRHQRVADELLRVCKPGGTVAMANFPPDGVADAFFSVFGPYMPPPREGDSPPMLWGSEDHVRYLFGDRVSSLEMTRRSYLERADSPKAYCEFCKDDLRSGRRDLREPRGRPGRGVRIGRSVPPLRGTVQPRPGGRTGRVRVRISAGRCEEERRQGVRGRR